MSSLKRTQLHREFYYNGIRIPDPGPALSVDQVRDLLTPNYPEIAKASVSGPEGTGSTLRYTFSRTFGPKGWACHSTTPLQPCSSRCLAREQERTPWPQTSCL